MAFNPDAFKKLLVYQARLPRARILADLQEVRGFDHRAERKRRLLLVLAIFGAGGFFASIPFADGMRPEALAFALVGVCALFPIICLVWRSVIRRYDLDDARYETLEALLGLLGADVAEAEPIRVRLDLDQLDAKRKHSAPTRRRGRYTITTSRDPWLEIEGRFRDGTRFQVTLVEEAEIRTHAKGRKRKAKHRYTVHLRLRPKPSRYGGLETLAEGAETALKLPRSVIVKRLTLESGDAALGVAWKVKTFNHKPVGRTQPHDPQELIPLLFLGLYQILNLSRRMTRRAG